MCNALRSDASEQFGINLLTRPQRLRWGLFLCAKQKEEKMRSIHFTLAALSLASFIAGCTVPKSVTSSVDMDYEKPMPPLELQKNQDDP